METLISNHLANRLFDWLNPTRLLGIALTLLVTICLFQRTEIGSCLQEIGYDASKLSDCATGQYLFTIALCMGISLICRSASNRHLEHELQAPVRDKAFRKRLIDASARIVMNESARDIVDAQVKYIEGKLSGYTRELKHRAVNAELLAVFSVNLVMIAAHLTSLGGFGTALGVTLLALAPILSFVTLKHAYSRCLDLAFGRWLPWEIMMAKILQLPTDLSIWETSGSDTSS